MLISAVDLYYRTSSDSQKELLTNINLNIKENDICILRGPSGSSKTVLLDLLANLKEPSSGILAYKKQNIEKLSAKEIKECLNEIVYIPHDPPCLWEKSLYSNMEYILKYQNIPADVIFDRIIHILKLTGLIGKRDLKPIQLSSVEKKVFFMAAALATEKNMIFCDLNIAGLPDEKDIIRTIKNYVFRGGTIVLTAKEKVKIKTTHTKYIDLINGKIK
ncbi:MAG: ATP-binding cassette domain-containing protein [Elusimicrobia bacterium]|jgi:putative ABC transport system ATP-binding protein|nr:ATP-binding cassette domain-containing protein [Elusimicrobiota bacterium]